MSLEDARNRDYPTRCIRCFHFKEHCTCNQPKEADKGPLFVRISVRRGQRTMMTERKRAARFN